MIWQYGFAISFGYVAQAKSFFQNSSYSLQDLLPDTSSDVPGWGMEPGTTFGIFAGILSSLAANHEKHLWLRGAFSSRGHTYLLLIRCCMMLFCAGYESIYHWTIPNIFCLGSNHGLEVHEVRWWMCHYKAPTPKRHVGFSNSKTIKKIDKGKLQGWKPTNKTVTVQHYIDGKGKRRYKGTTSLRAREILDTYRF